MPLPPLGLQTIIFGNKYNWDTQAVEFLDGLKEAGYVNLETGGPKDTQLFKKLLADRGMKLGGQHIAISGVKDPGPTIEYCTALGCKDVCNSGLLKWGKLEKQDYIDSIKVLNEMGKQFKKAGIEFHYHNHAFEFEKVDGSKTGMDLLIEGLDPAAIDFCIDVAWVSKGGEDPAQYLLKHNQRIGYLHLKDYQGDEWREVGSGVMDYASIMKVIPELKRVRWAMVEQDNTKSDPWQCVKTSRKYLKEKFNY